MISLRIVLALSLIAAAACGGDDDADDDVQPTVDAAVAADAPDNAPDASDDIDAGADLDAAAEPDAGPLTTSQQIALARAAADGVTDVAIAGALVTYVRPAVGGAPAGFYLQADQEGPALFVAVDPAAVAVGDAVTLRVTEMGTQGAAREARAVADLVVDSNGNDLSGLVQDVSNATDLVTAIADYEHELVTISGEISGDFGSAGAGHQGAQFDTAVITANADLVLRLPETLVDTLDLTNGCALTVTATPMGRFVDAAQPSAWAEADVTVTSCDAPTVVSALALSSTEVRVSFDRRVAPASVVADGSQFTFDNGLVASAATVDGRDVTLTTGTQIVATNYTVTVATTVTDTVGTALDAGANTATFVGFEVPAVLAINEVNANMTNGCDLIELRAVSGGQLAGVRVRERRDTLYTFPAMVVLANDIIVLHIDRDDATNCNGSGAVDETLTILDQPAVTHPQNFDTAYDVWSPDTGIAATTNVISVLGPTDAFQDAVFLTRDAKFAPAMSTVDAAGDAATAGAWEMVGGGIPAGGFMGADFSPHAVPDLNATSSDTAGDSLQRTSNTDTNTMADWGRVANTWGALNAGQIAD